MPSSGAISERNSGTLFGFPSATTIDLNQHSNEVWSCQFSHDGRRLATASQDRNVFIYDTSTFKVLHKSMEHGAAVSYICWSPDDSELLTCSMDQKARVWSVEV